MGDRSGFAWKDVPEYNYIDTLVYEKLQQVKVLPSELCTDAEFIRRIYLDLTGLPPQPDEVRAFLADTRPHARQARRAGRQADRQPRLRRALDEQVGRPAPGQPQVPRRAGGGRLPRLDPQGRGRQHALRQVRLRHPDGLAARTSTTRRPATYKILRDPDAVMENTTQLFLAVRFNCNKCHDHPFERWTQDQYYQLSAYFAQVSRSEIRLQEPARRRHGRRRAAPLVEIISDVKTGDVTHIRTGVVTPPTFPFTHIDLAPPTASRREQLDFSRDESQKLMYIVNQNSAEVEIMDRLTGELVSRFGRPGHFPGEFDQPHGLAVDFKGDVYVTENHGQRAQKFKPVSQLKK